MIINMEKFQRKKPNKKGNKYSNLDPKDFNFNQQVININNNFNFELTNSAEKRNRKRQFIEREGDWVCMKCKNKNFSFRIICNRCKLPKEDSDKLYEQHMLNLSKLVKQNEMLQQQVFNKNCPNLAYNQNLYAFNPNLFSPNSSPLFDNNNNNNNNLNELNNNYYLNNNNLNQMN